MITENEISNILMIYDRKVMNKKQALALLFINPETEELEKKQWEKVFNKESQLHWLSAIFDRGLISKKTLLKQTYNLDYDEI